MTSLILYKETVDPIINIAIHPRQGSRMETSKFSYLSDEDDDSSNIGRWTSDEHLRFVEAYRLYGKDWRKLARHVETRNNVQCRTHAQKHFKKLKSIANSSGKFRVQKPTTIMKKPRLAGGDNDSSTDEDTEKEQLLARRCSLGPSSVESSTLPRPVDQQNLQPLKQRTQEQAHFIPTYLQGATIPPPPSRINQELPRPLPVPALAWPPPAIPHFPVHSGVLLQPNLLLQPLPQPLLRPLPSSMPYVFQELSPSYAIHCPLPVHVPSLSSVPAGFLRQIKKQ